ncbi:MAG TPA: ribonuclease Z [archaeon]|jgi:ribonuclease Z|nr:ribonuclease Z [archaeon]
MSNKIKVFFLGNSASLPTAERNLSSMLINYNGQNYLFDCPENCQQQIMRSKQSIMKINNIFLSHMHGDHFFGILGLLSSFKLNNRIAQLNIFVPKNEKKNLEQLIKLTIYDKYPPEYKINIVEVEKNIAYQDKEIKVEAISLDHTTRTNGYIFKVKDKVGKFNKEKALKLKIPEGPLFSQLQKGKSIKLKGKTIKPEMVMDYKFKKIGKKIAYLCDTQVLKNIPKELIDIDIMVHECTFFVEDKDKARLVKHAVAEEVPIFSKKAKVKHLYLTHISSKYNDLEKREKQLQKKNKGQKINIVHGLKEIELNDY